MGLKEAIATRSVCRSKIREEERRERASLSLKKEGNGFELEAAMMVRVGLGVVL